MRYGPPTIVRNATLPQQEPAPDAYIASAQAHEGGHVGFRLEAPTGAATLPFGVEYHYCRPGEVPDDVGSIEEVRSASEASGHLTVSGPGDYIVQVPEGLAPGAYDVVLLPLFAD